MGNINSMDFFKIFLVILVMFVFNEIKYIPFEFNYMLIFVFLGVVFLLYSFDFLMVFLTLELQNFSLYILMSMQRNKKIAVETGIRYYFLGGISSGLILYGISLFYGFSGKIRFSDLNLGIIFFLCGLFMKIGLAPFHFWIPQIYSGAPNIITLILLVLPKFGFFILFMKLYYYVFTFMHLIFFDLICIIVLFSLFFGALGALGESNIKRFMGYSGITNSGFILLAFSVFTYEGLFAGILYLLVYIFTTFSVFCIFLISRLRQVKSYYLVDFNSFNSLKLINPFLVFILCINLFSMAGIPPLTGFFSKYYLFLSLVEINNIKLLFCLIILSLISTYYYIRPINLLVFSNNVKPKFFEEINSFSCLLIFFIYVVNSFMIIQPRFILDLVQSLIFFY